MASPFSQLSNMVLSHASEEGVTGGGDAKVAAGAKSLVDNLKSMLSKPPKEQKAA
jgi:pilus assembly protein CpaE